MKRRPSIEVAIGGISLGGEYPIRVQSMTDTPTRKVAATAKQIKALADAGSELVRIAISNRADAAAVPEIRSRLDDLGCAVPLIGDFHFIGHELLAHPGGCARVLDKYRINPGNIGFGQSRDTNFDRILEIAGENDKPIRIGANWGSLEKEVRSRLLQEHPDWPLYRQLEEAMVESARESAAYAVRFGIPENKIVLSAKVSHVPTLLNIYRKLAKETEYALHLGLTEAGSRTQGIVASTAALSVLLQEGIGDTIRVSITPRKRTLGSQTEPRTEEVTVSQRVLQANGIRAFFPVVISCPGCGRANRKAFRATVDRVTRFVSRHEQSWRRNVPKSAGMTIAVMGCPVNGFEEGKHANLGICVPDQKGKLAPIAFMDGERIDIPSNSRWKPAFLQMIEGYVHKLR